MVVAKFHNGMRVARIVSFIFAEWGNFCRNYLKVLWSGDFQ
jgi:hypothetical protein